VFAHALAHRMPSPQVPCRGDRTTPKVGAGRPATRNPRRT
jgi:hypothetical protein